MEIAGADSVTDLGTQLDGNVRGPLKTFKVVPGQVVTLSVRVLDGNDRFAVQLKDFEKPARRTDSNNLLTWRAANDPGNVWTRQEVSNPPYFTKDNGANGGISGSTGPITYTFDLLVESGTPFDVYELVFAVPGRRSGTRVYQEEHFYLEVTAPAFDFNGDGIVDGADDYGSTDFTLNPVEGSFSVLAWIKGGAPGQVIISQTDVTAGRNTIFGSTWLGMNSSDGKLVTMLMEPPFGPLESEAVITDGQWHHVGLVYDLDALSRHLYVDGVEVAVDTDPVGGVTSEGSLYFGAGKSLEQVSFFSGFIDDIRIYPLALNAEELAALVR